MEDSVLNVETVETRNRELSAVDTSLRKQLSTLDTEATRLRTDNRELRARLVHLEQQDARSSGHQNPAQKISYLQHLKEIILKHQQVRHTTCSCLNWCRASYHSLHLCQTA